MTQEHPITPPQTLINEWWNNAPEDDVLDVVKHIATQAARWGADQQLQLDIEQVNQAWQRGADHELEACCEWIGSEGLAGYTSRELRAARRPKPPSLKEQALEQLKRVDSDLRQHGIINTDFIRRALEQLND